MDIQGIVAELKQQASRIEQAIAALAGFGQPAPHRGRRPKATRAKQVGRRGPRTMSAAARAKIAAAQRARWAKQKRKALPKKAAVALKKVSSRKPMSPAMRKKLSAMMKARWAEKKAKA